jgi:MFS family permease
VPRRTLPRRLSYGVIVYGLTMLVATGTVPLGLYQAYADEFHFSPAVLTLLAAATMFGVIAAVVLFGNLSDRIGRRAVLLPAVLVGALSMVLFIVANGVAALLAARISSGLAVGLFTGAGTAALTELVGPGGDTRRAATHAATTSIAGFAIGPLVGGVFVQYGPWPLQLVFVVSLVLLVPLFVGVLLMAETVRNREPFRIRLQPLGAPREGRRAFELASIVAGCCFAGASFFQSLGPTVAIVLLGISNRLVAVAMAVCFLGTSAIAQVGFRGQPIRRATLTGLVLLPFGFACVVASLLTDSLPLFVVGALTGGLGQGLAYLGGQSLVEKATPPAQRGEAFSLYMIVIYVTGGATAISFGLLAKWIGLDPAAIMYGTFVAAISIVTVIVSVRSGLLRAPGDAKPIARRI